jgi:hypothetical protein
MKKIDLEVLMNLYVRSPLDIKEVICDVPSVYLSVCTVRFIVFWIS